MARTGRRNPNYPSFFKVLIGDFSTSLKVPPALKNFKPENLPIEVTICLKSDVRISWKVKLQRSSGSGCYYLRKGWSKLVKDLKLAVGDFLVFYLEREHVFLVTAYGPTCCEKKIPSLSSYMKNQGTNLEVKTEEENNNNDNQEQKNEKRSLSRRPCYCKTLARYQQYFFTVPLWFIIEAGLENMKEIVVRDPRGKKWRVKMKLRKSNRYRRYDLIAGWKDFIRGNGLAVGDELKLEHIEGCMVEVTVLSRASRHAKN